MLPAMHDDTAFLGKAWKSVRKAAKKAARRASPVAALAGDVLKATPMGAAAGAAIGGATALARGQRIDRAALAAARGAVPGGALGRAAFDAGVNVARGQRIDRAALGAARGAAVDAMRGAVPGARLPGIVDPLAAFGARKVAELSTVRPAVDLAARALRANPTLTAAGAHTVARALGVSPQIAQDALRLVGPRALPWRPLSRRAAGFLRRFSLVPERALSLADTGALTVGPARIKLQSGDLPYLVAKKYAGDQSKWSQIASVNPGMKVVHNKDKSGKVIWSGLSPWYANLEVNLPPTWPNLPGGSAPAPSAPSVPGTIPAVSEVTTAAILQAKATLAAWSKTDGVSSAGVSDYGTKLEDASPAWGPRDRFTLTAFSAWWNKANTPALGTTGDLSAAHSSALRTWAEKKAAAPSAPAVPAPSTPAEPAPQVLPPMVIPGGTTPLPSWPPAQTDPAHPVDPWPTSPGQPQPGGASPFPSLPPMPSVPMPGTIPASTPAAPAKSADSGLGALAAIGALVALLT